MLTTVLEQIGAEQHLDTEKSAPGVEVVCRGEGEDRICMVINHNPRPVEYEGMSLAPFQCSILPA